MNVASNDFFSDTGLTGNQNLGIGARNAPGEVAHAVDGGAHANNFGRAGAKSCEGWIAHEGRQVTIGPPQVEYPT